MIADYILIGIALTAILIGYLAMAKTRRADDGRKQKDRHAHDKKRLQ